MCTLTYIPTSKSGFVFTTNRDENGKRPTAPPSHNKVGDQVLLYPKDLEAMGTWMASNGTDTSVCLLNGAYTRHKRKDSYRKSRGVMTLEFFAYASVLDFLQNYCFADIEPFTLVIVSHLKELLLYEIRWDGESIHYRKLDGLNSHIWSSATLYSPEVAKTREGWFWQWLDGNPNLTQKEILDFHHRGGKEDVWNGLIMNRNNRVKTVSISSVEWKKGRVEMVYEDLQLGICDQIKFNGALLKDS